MKTRDMRVIASYNFESDLRCVDVFVREDGTYGFECFRRDPEDGRGWYPIGGFSSLVFENEQAATAEACDRVPGFAVILNAG